MSSHHDRPLQREVIDAALQGQDVFLQAATSFGKSLCFQLPAVIDFGCKATFSSRLLPANSTSVTVVVSPLLALMVSQAELMCKNPTSLTLSAEEPGQQPQQRLRAGPLHQQLHAPQRTPRNLQRPRERSPSDETSLRHTGILRPGHVPESATHRLLARPALSPRYRRSPLHLRVGP